MCSLGGFTNRLLSFRFPLGTALLFLSGVCLQAATFNIANGDLSGLGIAIQLANNNGTDDTINLATNGLYTSSGAFATETALPAIESDTNHTLTFNGNGAALRRSTNAGTPDFRLLLVGAGARVVVDRLTIQNGHLASGSGAGLLNFGNLTLTNCVVRGNGISGGAPTASALGGGIINNGGATLVVNDSTISGNTASAGQSGQGGGIYNNFGTVILNRSTISGNTVASTTTPRGGGVATRGAPFMAINCTISGNSATGATPSGGGLYHEGIPGAPSLLLNTTFANNSTGAGGRGGGIYERSSGSSSTLSVLNTIIATNTSPTGPDVSQGAGPIISLGHNLVGQTDGSSGWIASDLTGTSAIPLDPVLAPLEADFMHALLGGSPAIEAADDVVLGPPHHLATDQRLVPRRVGAQVDIGAFEVEPAQTGLGPLVTTTLEHNDGVCGIADCTLGEALAFANTNPDATTITFRTGLNGVITTRSTPAGLIVNTPVTIAGPGARILTVSGDHFGRIFVVDGGPTVISGLTLANARSTVSSGGAIASSADLTVNSCRFDQNFASADGGAVYNVGPLALNNCTFSGNIANGGFGGAIHNFADSFARGNVTAINCTFSHNRAVGGGAVSNKASGRTGLTTLRNCTVSGNLASLNGTNQGGGLINQGTATHSRIRLENSIVAANTSDDGAPDIFGAIVSGSSSLVGDGTGSTGLTNGVNNDQVGTGAAPLNPQLGPLQDNGGPTDTRALFSNSLARDSANNANAPPSDQRGYVRAGIADKGAFEFDGIVLRITNVERNGSNLVVTFDAAGERTYRLERASSVAQPTIWEPTPMVNDLIPGTSGSTEMMDPNSPNDKAFYRVRLPP